MVEGKMAVMATFAIVIGALDGDFPRDRQPVLGSVADEAGVLLAEGANVGGADVPLFLLASMPA